MGQGSWKSHGRISSRLRRCSKLAPGVVIRANKSEGILEENCTNTIQRISNPRSSSIDSKLLKLPAASSRPACRRRGLQSCSSRLAQARDPHCANCCTGELYLWEGTSSAAFCPTGTPHPTKCSRTAKPRQPRQLSQTLLHLLLAKTLLPTALGVLAKLGWCTRWCLSRR